MRLNIILSLVLIFTCCDSLKSQIKLSVFEKVQLGMNVGPLFFLGDLGGGIGDGTKFIKDIDLRETRPAVEFHLQYYPLSWFGLRAGIMHGSISGDDKNSPNLLPIDQFLFERNLSFKSNLEEIYFGIEFNPLHILRFKETSFFSRLQPYGFAGAGVFTFNPKGKDTDGTWVELKPLRLEGQGFSEYPNTREYSLIQTNILTGFGIRYFINPNTYVGFETIHRTLFSDYIDDVSERYYVDPILFDKYLSPEDAALAKRLYYRGFYNLGGALPHEAGIARGNPKNADSYFFVSVQFGKKLFRAKDKSIKCPTVF